MNNLKSYTEYAVTTPTTDFVIGFDFNYGTDAVNVTVDGVPATDAGYSVIYLNSTTMQLSPAVPSGVVRLQRETDIDVPDNQFTAGAKFIASNMDENFTQIRHAQQEVRDGFERLSDDTYEIIDTLQVVGQAAQDAADAAEQAAQTANDAAAQVNDKVSYQDLAAAVDNAVAATPHNNLADRDVTGAHTASAILDVSGVTQQEINTNQINLNAKVKSSVIYAAEYNLSESEDNTTIYNQIINDAADGAKIVFPYAKTLPGHFISENKALNIDFNGCTLINTVDNTPIVQLGPLSATEYTVTESVLNYGDTQFTVANASTLFKVGDIGYLWDSATRSTTGSVNFESVKIKAISGNIITVENFLASHKGAGPIKFYHSAAQLKNPAFSNVNLKPTSTHNSIVSLIANSENPSVSNIETIGTTGNSVAIRYCYGLNANNIRPLKAAAVGSGQGYGLALLSVSNVRVVGVNGSGMRHVYDQDSTYFFDVQGISDDDAKNVPCMLAHNGFAGHGTCENVSTVFNSSVVYLSSQGYNGGVAALKRNHPFRKIHIKNINNRIPANSGLATSSAVLGVYFQNSVIGCSVDGIDVEAFGDDVLTQTSGSSLVRVNGVVRGGLSLSKLKANKVGRGFFGIGADSEGLDADGSQVVIQDVQIGDCAYVYLIQGGFYVKVDNISLLSLPKSNTIGLAQVQSGVSPLGVSHGRSINYPLSGVVELNCNAASTISGNLSGISKMSSNRLPLINGQEITLAQLQERSEMFLINPPTGVGSISVILPKPQTSSDTVSFSNPAGRNSVTLSGDNMNANVTVDAGQIVKLMVIGSKWSLVSRLNNS